MPDTKFHDARLSERPTGWDTLAFVVALLAQSLSVCAQGAELDMPRYTATQNQPVSSDLVVRTPNEHAEALNRTAWPALSETIGANSFAEARDLVARSKPLPTRMPDGEASLGSATTRHLTLDTLSRPTGLQNLWASPATRQINLRTHGTAADPTSTLDFASGVVAERTRLRKLAGSATQVSERKRSVPAEAASHTLEQDDALPRELSCEIQPADGVIELEDAILSAICANPQARSAWANARAAAAALNLARTAYLPALNITGNASRNTLSSTYDFSAIGLSSVSQAQRSLDRQASLELNWVLYDFGKRSAGKRRASALLDAAGAEYDETLQRVFFNAAQAYYAVQDAQATADAARQAEVVAGAGLAVARARHANGAGGMSDLLQASTAYRRAQVERVNADGAARAAYGALAVAMGRDANTPLDIAPAVAPDTVVQVSQNVDRLIETAKAHRPSLEAARARLAAAQADVDAARAQYWPTISLVGRLDKTSNPATQQSFGSAPISGSHSSMVGVQINIPLTDGIATRYRTAQARAARDAEEAGVQDAELQASLDVWQAYQELQTDAKNLGNTQSLLSEAIRSLELARGRYKEGIGTLLELLTAQTSQADAQKQRIQAISRWRLGRLRLAQSLGTLGLWDLTQ